MSEETQEKRGPGRPPAPWKGKSRFDPYSLKQFIHDMDGGLKAAVGLMREAEAKYPTFKKFLAKWDSYAHDWRKLARVDVVAREAGVDRVELRKDLVRARADWARDAAKMRQYERAEELAEASIDTAVLPGEAGKDERLLHLKELGMVELPQKGGGVNVSVQQGVAVPAGLQSFEQMMMEADRALRGGEVPQLPPAADYVDAEEVESDG